MVAVIGYPGEQKHVWMRFTRKDSALRWLTATGTQLHALHPAWPAALYSQRIVTEKEAARCRYRDGRLVYPRSVNNGDNWWTIPGWGGE